MKILTNEKISLLSNQSEIMKQNTDVKSGYETSNAEQAPAILEDVIYMCGQCKKEHSTSSGMIQHMLSIHRGDPTIKQLLKTQKLRLKASKRKIVRKSRYSCKICPYVTQHMITFQRHMKKHNKEYSSCPYCSYKSVQPHNVTLHVKNVHPDKEQLHKARTNLLVESNISSEQGMTKTTSKVTLKVNAIEGCQGIKAIV